MQTFISLKKSISSWAVSIWDGAWNLGLLHWDGLSLHLSLFWLQLQFSDLFNPVANCILSYKLTGKFSLFLLKNLQNTDITLLDLGLAQWRVLSLSVKHESELFMLAWICRVLQTISSFSRDITTLVWHQQSGIYIGTEYIWNICKTRLFYISHWKNSVYIFHIYIYIYIYI